MTDREGRHHELAREIIDHLPGPWFYSDEDSQDYYAVLRFPHGGGIKLRIDSRRLRVTGVWPKPVVGHHHAYTFEPFRHGHDAPTITCNPNRGAEAIAKDIARRFLPQYSPLYAVMVNKRTERIAENALEVETIQALLDAGAETAEGNKVYFRYKSGNAPHGRIEVQVRGDEMRISIDVAGVPLETAKCIVAELADCKRAIMTEVEGTT